MARSIRSKDEMQPLQAYELLNEEYLDDIKSLGLIFRHKKSGARIVVLSNQDDNKVFSVGFRTPPEDSTGVAHIVEHTVLCGSREFPVKDPFIELVKGSLNTFLNAITYPDKTIYPVASCNEKDFQNLMHVYLDAVFYPNIYIKEEIFKQEGWHYALEDPEDDIKYNGVVYNEMKGAFSSPEQKLMHMIQTSLFPDTTYGFVSGGDPNCITDLTYEQFLDFHGRYYHPINSYIYLYGDMDIEEKLNWIDEQYLSHFDQIEIDSSIRMQKPFDEMREVVEYYSVTEEEGEQDKTYLSYNIVLGSNVDCEHYIAFKILDYVLLSAPGAPLKQALLDANIGKDILSDYESSILQPTFSIIAKGAREEQKSEFVRIIKETLKEIIKNKIQKKSLLAAINNFEFKYREADYGQFPKGLMYDIRILDSWLYDEKNPFMYMKANETFAKLREKVETNYYEELIQTYLLENKFGSIGILKPQIGYTKIEEERVAQKLKEYKEGLSKTEIERLIKQTLDLKKYQEEETPKEELEKIPMLSIDDIGKKIRPLKNQESQINEVKILHHNVYTSKIAYIRMAFSIDKYSAYIPQLSLLSNLLGNMDTKKYSYLDFSNEVNIHTGGISTDIQIFNKINEIGKVERFFIVTTKVLYQNIGKALEFICEMLRNTVFHDKKRLKELLNETKSSLEMRLMSASHLIAVNRSLSYFSENGIFADDANGIGYYRYIDDLNQHFEEKYNSFLEEIEGLRNNIFTKDNLLISITADEEGYELLFDKLPDYMNKLQADTEYQIGEKIEKERKAVGHNEGFKTSGQVQFVARSGNFLEKNQSYHGSLKVLKVILGYDYLWNQIRVKGGAYGCMCGFSYDGLGYFVSYRDPNLERTNEVFKKTIEYVENFQVDERNMTKYIIGAISDLDQPLTPFTEGKRSFSAYITGVTEEMLQKDRDEVLNTNVDQIKKLAPIIKTIIDADHICVIGNEDKIIQQKELFKNIENLL